ncbi:MAG: riboflavin biosynthesis protein RibD [Lentisphaerae bacterium GWF2_52_8]|nr:MAG: riboflavin biosynthesis protein RibD [Lentisphaerae bacterium GWF2_52_8]
MAALRDDAKWMRMALSWAKRAWGRTSPNPMVGAVVVLKNGVCAAAGCHWRAGEPHAEVNALAAAGEKARGASLYVTLEPCSTTGRTPPCTDAILSAGIPRVVVGTLDPNPKHAGRGIEILRSAGLDVSYGVEEQRCLELNEAFFKWIVRKRPFVLLKMAMTLDGKIATANGSSQWISGALARRRVQKLRQWADAIMVGGETVRLDHPSLSVRIPKNWPRQPRRLVATRSLSVSELGRMMPAGIPAETVCAETPQEWDALLLRLGSENVTSLLIEGGGELAASALQAGVLDKIEFHIAPKLLCGRESRTVMGGLNPHSLAESWKLEKLSFRRLGEDLCVSAYPAQR